jgi:hypothetical protein
MPATRRRRIRIGMIGATALALGAAGIAGAMGWVMGGTTEAIRDYDRRTESTTAKDPVRIVESDPATVPAATTVPLAAPRYPADAWVPVNNAIQWASPIPPGTPLSGLSVRNGDQDVHLVVHLAARSTAGGWIPVASMTVAAGREGILHPPAGDYSMTLVAAPVGMAFDRVAGLPASPATTFRMDPTLRQGGIEPVRFSVSKGTVRRLPVPASARPDRSMPKRPSATTTRAARIGPETPTAVVATQTGTTAPASAPVVVEDAETEDPTGADAAPDAVEPEA